MKVKQLRIKTNPNFQLVNKSSRIGPHEILQLSMIDTVFYLLVKNNKGKGGGVGVKTEGGLLSKLSSMKRGAYFERGGAGRGLIEDLRYCYYWFFANCAN